MSSYFGKMLELLSIHNEPENTSITVKLTFEKEILINWKIDEVTANHLKALSGISENFKFRLSFQSFWDTEKGMFISFLTKTFCDYTEKISFPCTQEFLNHLQVLKDFSDIDELHAYPAFTIILPKKEAKQTEEKPARPRVSRFAVAILSIFTLILMGFSGHLFLNETAFAKKEMVTHEKPPLSNKKKKQPSAITHVNVEKKKVQIVEDQTPSVELTNPVTFSIADGSVALTFDDGPSKYTKGIVDVLKKYQVGGTFFFIGQNVKKYPASVQYVSTNGLSIGNHSMNHPVFPEIPYTRQVSELTKTNTLIEKITSKPVLLFRPPYEAKNEETLNLVQQNHMKMVLWNRDTDDWKTDDPIEIINYIKQTQSSGAIILLHESQAVLSILPKIIEYLESQHLKIVNLNG